MNTDKPVRIFAAFAQADRKQAVKLLAFLEPLRQQGLIEENGTLGSGPLKTGIRKQQRILFPQI